MGDLDLPSDLAGVEDFESLSADMAGLVERLVVGVVEDDNNDSGGGMAAPDERNTEFYRATLR